MSKVIRSSVAFALGVVSSVLTAALLAFVQSKFGLALYSFSLWLILPVGAVFYGFASASGYYLGYKRFNLRPTTSMLLMSIFVSVGSLALIYWLEYVTTLVNGSAISGLLSFTEFVKLCASNTRIHLGYRGHFIPGAGIEVGAFGYVLAGLHVLGYALGGCLVYLLLRAAPFCENCKRYLRSKAKQTRYHETADHLSDAARVYVQFIQSGHYQNSVSVHAASGDLLAGSKKFSSSIDIMSCSGCGLHRLRFDGKRKAKDDWNNIPGLTFVSSSLRPVEIGAVPNVP